MEQQHSSKKHFIKAYMRWYIYIANNLTNENRKLGKHI